MSAPWKKPRPAGDTPTKLSEENLAWARDRARRAGRRYPNLVDNMAATRRQREQQAERDGPGRNRP